MLRLLRTLFGAKSVGGSGEKGEQLAAAWLQRERGFSVVARNWRNPQDRREEIDLVCRDRDVMVFVEVKARAAGALVPGYHAVDERKKRVLRRAIETYLARLREKPLTFRFDVVEVALPSAVASRKANPAKDAPLPAPEILHFENVPLFSKHFRA
jgi:putative endonuclease